MRRYAIALLLCVILGCCVEAQLVQPLPQDYDAVLIPLAPRDVEGAHGSLWSYEFAVLNSSSETLVGYVSPVPREVPPPDLYPAWDGCIFPICDGETSFPPGRVQGDVLGANDYYFGRFGLLLYLRKSATPKFQLQLRVKDFSRNTFTAGTELPPIPVRDFVHGTLHLLNLPTDPRFRLTLRVYDASPRPENLVRIRVIRQATNELIYEATHMLRQPEYRLEDTYPGFPLHPDFLELSEIPTGSGSGTRIRIEVESLQSDAAIWAFASITNNDTQEVTVVSPFRRD